MRQITIDFDKMLVSGLVDNKYAGYLGEHNATEITLIKPKELEGVAFSVAFMTNGEVVHSKFFNGDETISVALWQQLTQDNTLYVQLEAYDSVGDYLGKSNIAKLYLGSSVHGVDVIADADNADVYSDIALNSLFRETLEDNVDTLDKLTTSEDGKLLFNGKEIEGGNAPVGEFVKPEDLEAYRRIDVIIPSSEVEYVNNMLTDETNTVKGALDEAVGFVLENMPDLVAKKHTHSNKTVLDKFSVNADNELQFDGNVVQTNENNGANDKPETDIIMVKSIVDDDGYVSADPNTQTLIFESLNIPANARVVKVEIPDVVNGTDEYIQLEDMIAKDSMGINAPYYIMYPKNLQNIFTVAAIVVFTISGNGFMEAASAFSYSGKTIQIYYKIEE